MMKQLTMQQVALELLKQRTAIEQGDISGLPFHLSTYFGLCDVMRTQGCDVDFKTAIKTWEHYTGSADYPVPMSLSDVGTDTARCAYHRTSGNLYTTSEYGQVRWALIEYLSTYNNEVI